VSVSLHRYRFCLVVVGRLNSECPQQDRANERKHGAHR
jgi:hypothetical protein